MLLYFLVERDVLDGCLESPYEVRPDSRLTSIFCGIISVIEYVSKL